MFHSAVAADTPIDVGVGGPFRAEATYTGKNRGCRPTRSTGRNGLDAEGANFFLNKLNEL